MRVTEETKDDWAPRSLREYIVPWHSITPADVDGFEKCLRNATREEDVQQYLQEHPVLIVQHLSTAGRFVIPKKRLGAEFVPDFLVGEQDSVGLRWTLVELESPATPGMFTKGGLPSRTLNTAVAQIRSWRAWLGHNRDYAVRAKTENGLGLTEIEPAAPGLILIGRRASLSDSDAERRRQIEQESAILIHTFDWLVEVARSNVDAAADMRMRRGGK